jgi:hypothetical protein
LTADGSDDNEVCSMQGMTDYTLPVVPQDGVTRNIIDNIVDEVAQDGFKLIIDAIGPDAQNPIEDDAALIDEEDEVREEGDDEDDCD